MMPRAERLVEQIRVGEGGRAEHDAVGTRAERPPNRRERAQAATELNRHGRARA